MDMISTDGISVRFNRDGGVIDEVAIEAGGQTLRPLHRAPWVRSGEVLPDHVAPVERRLAGDFFCAPFGQSEPGVPIHGWSANGAWDDAGSTVAADGVVIATYSLREAVAGARLTKRIMLCPGQPIVYQTHIFEGGAGHLPVAHHAMVHVPGGAKLSFSPKSGGRTMPAPPESDPARGRSILAYPQSFSDMSSVRRSDGAAADTSFYPFDSGHEDIVVLSEKPGARIGWSAAVASRDGFLFFAVKDARVLPQTVLWMSNGGRAYSPWNSRHIAVLGIEEAATSIHLDAGENAPDGVLTSLSLDPGPATTIRYAFGAIPAPAGWSEVTDIRLVAAAIEIADRGGQRLAIPFHGSFFAD